MDLLSQLFHRRLKRNHVFAGKFRETRANPSLPKRTAARDEIYVTIALTDLSPDNGWYIFYEGSRADHPIPDENRTVQMRLEAGDAVIWRGDLVYTHPTGGGGMFQTLVYKSSD